MPSGFPPVPVYPNDYDSDTTLFLVYNTAEAKTTEDVDPYAEEIPVRPRGADQDEVWADNGYANIAGELFYYDAVDKNGNDKVCRLKRCVRNLGGRETQFNSAGTWVRGFVIAEHHNQLADATLLVENFIGENFSPDPATLDWRIRHLSDSPIQGDDYCPEVQFDFEIVSTSPATGTITRYNVKINGGGSFVLQFGDGTSTTTVGSGTHVYAPGSNIDPVVVVSTDLCQIVQSPIFRSNPQTPVPSPLTPPFVVPVPVPPTIPSIIIPSIVIPPPTTNIPPVVFPCVNPGGLPSMIVVSPPINIPSFIDIAPIPSQIQIVPPISIPSRILGPNIQIPSEINFNGPPTISIAPPPPIPPIQCMPPNIPPIQFAPGSENVVPSVIQVDAARMPRSIRLKDKLPSVIRLEGPASISLLGMPTAISLIGSLPDRISIIGFPANGGGMSLIHNLPDTLRLETPKLEFDIDSMKRLMTTFGETLIETVKVTLPDFNNIKVPDLKVDWGEIPTLRATLKLQKAKKRKHTGKGLLPDINELEHEELDFPGEFKLVAPEIPPLEVKHNIPKTIALQLPDLKSIKLDASEVPREIRLVPPKEGLQVSVVPFNMPKIEFDVAALRTMSVPIRMPKPEDMPAFRVEFPTEIPKIKVEFPSIMPTLKVEVPDNTRIPLFYDGPPIAIEPVQINLKIQNLAGEAAQDVQCVAIVPCPRK